MIRVAMDPYSRNYLDALARHKVLSKAEERALLTLAQAGNELAIRSLVTHNLKFVITVAAQFRGNGLGYDELIAEGAIGIRIATQRFDMGCKFKFMSYAVWWIRQCMLRALDNQARLIRLSPPQELAIKKLRAMPLQQFIGGEYLNLEEDFAEFPPYTREAQAATTAISAETPINDDGTPYGVFLRSETQSPEDWTAGRELGHNLSRLLHLLEPKERRVVVLCFGIDTGEPLTLIQVGDLMGLSNERVRQIRNGALAKMRKAAQKKGLGPTGAQRPEPAPGEGSISP